MNLSSPNNTAAGTTSTTQTQHKVQQNIIISYPSMASMLTLVKPFTFQTIILPSSLNQRPLGLKFSSSLKVNAIAKSFEPTKVKPQGDRVLVRLEDLPAKSAGGVLLPKSAVKFERYLMGEILSVGADVDNLETGKKVLFSDISAYEVDLGAEGKHCFCKAGDLLAVVE